MTQQISQPLSERGQYWLNHIRQWAQMNITQAKYCRDHHLSGPAFSWWRRQLIKKGWILPEDHTTKRSTTLTEPFLEISSLNEAPHRNIKGIYEIVFPNQRCLRLPYDFDPQAVATLISVLEQPC